MPNESTPAHHGCGCGGKKSSTPSGPTTAELSKSLSDALDAEEQRREPGALGTLLSLLADHPGLRLTLSFEQPQ